MNELEVVSEKVNPLMGRKEMTLKMKAGQATPSHKHVMEAISSKFGNSQDCIVIDRIEQQFGAKTVKVLAKIYDKPEAAKLEPAYKFARVTGEKKAAAPKKEKKKAAKK